MIRGKLIRQMYVYDAWGNHQIKTGANGIGAINPIRYRGYYYDTETGLYYLQSRYYDPETGRFISQDDVSYLAPTHLSGLNLYAYCNDNPVMGYDPNGTFVITGAAVLTAVIVGGIAGLIIGGLYGGLTAAANGQDVYKGIGIGMLTGTIMGIGTGLASLFIAPVMVGETVALGIAGATISSGSAIAIGTAIAFGSGAIGGAISDVFNQISNYGQVEDFGSVIFTALEWGVLNTASAYLSSMAGPLDGVASFALSQVFGHWTGAIGLLIDIMRARKSDAQTEISS